MVEYRAFVLHDYVSPGMTVKKALSIYKKWHLLSRQPKWVKIPFSCSSAVCFPHCACQDTLQFASLFNPEVRVPQDWVAATVSARKLCTSFGGTAGRKRRRLIEERTCDEKTIDSKVKYLNVATPPSPAPKPVVVMPQPDEDVMPGPSPMKTFRYNLMLAAHPMHY